MNKNKDGANAKRYWFFIGLFFFGFTFFPYPSSALLSLIFITPIIFFTEKSETAGEFLRFVFPIVFAAYFAHNFTTIYIPMALWDKIQLVIVFNILYSLLFLIPITFYFFVSKKMKSSYRLWLLPACWVIYEYFINESEIGIAILSLHNTLNYYPFFTNGLAFIGTIGYSALVVTFNVFMYMIITSEKPKRNSWLVGFACLLLGFLVFNAITRDAYSSMDEKRVNVAIIQPNFNNKPVKQKEEAESRVRNMISLSGQVNRGTNLIVWPESAIQHFIINMDSLADDRAVSYIRKCVHQLGVPILAGSIVYRFYKNKSEATPTSRSVGIDSSDAFYDVFNAALLITPDTLPVQLYIKNKLVPFVERMPYINYFPFVDAAKLSVGDAYPSCQVLSNKQSLKYRDMKILPLICSEGAYFNYASKHLMDANIIVSLSNEGWTGKKIVSDMLNNFMFPLSAGLKRSVVKCANNGVSFSRDEQGEMLAETKFGKQQILNTSVPLNSAITFYCLYQNIINVVICAIFIGLVVYGELKSKLL